MFERLYETMLHELASPGFGAMTTPRTGKDTRPSFAQVLEQHHLTCAQVAEQAGIAVEHAQALSNGQPVFVEHIDGLLTALSTLTGHTYTRLTVGHLHVRFDAKQGSGAPEQREASS